MYHARGTKSLQDYVINTIIEGPFQGCSQLPSSFSIVDTTGVNDKACSVVGRESSQRLSIVNPVVHDNAQNEPTNHSCRRFHTLSSHLLPRPLPHCLKDPDWCHRTSRPHHDCDAREHWNFFAARVKRRTCVLPLI